VRIKNLSVARNVLLSVRLQYHHRAPEDVDSVPTSCYKRSILHLEVHCLDTWMPGKRNRVVVGRKSGALG
jgi:hypothetical protein